MKRVAPKAREAKLKPTTNPQPSTDAHDFKIQAHFYCGLMGEAISSIVAAYQLHQESLRIEKDGDNSLVLGMLLRDAGIQARYAFLVACNALENAAYSILANCGKLSSALTEDIDKLGTLNKFELFALIHGKVISRGDHRYERVRQVIKCRNDFVHPKGLLVGVQANVDKIETKLASGRTYPKAFDFIEIEHAAQMIGDVLSFIAWVVFDICKFPQEAGERLINGNIKSASNDLYLAQATWNYDIRSLGDFTKIPVKAAKEKGCAKSTRIRS